MVQSAKLMGWKTKVDGLPFVLPMGYSLREPFVTILNNKRQMLASEPFDLICLENADNDSLAILNEHRNYRGFHVIRDPRDIVVSGYFSHRYSHRISAYESPWLYEHRKRLESLSNVEEGLLAEIIFCAIYFERLRTWNYDNPRVFELRYESLIIQPKAAFQQIFDFLGIKTPLLSPLLSITIGSGFLLNKCFGLAMLRNKLLPKPILTFILWRNSFNRRSGGRLHGEEDQRNHYRKGVSGDWRNYFTPKVKDAFKERYAGLLSRLGYEADENW
jgi:hypothetical protein